MRVRSVALPPSMYAKWRSGRRRLIVLPKNKTSQAIRYGDIIEVNGSSGGTVLDIVPFASVRQAHQDSRWEDFLPGCDLSEAIALWRDYVARKKPNGMVLAFRIGSA